MIPQAAIEAAAVAGDLIGRRKFVAAEIVMRRAICVMPQASELWCNLSLALWNQRRPQEAHEAAQEALRLKPDSAPALSTLGLACGSLGYFDEADAAFTRSLELRPGDTATIWNRSLLRIGTGDFSRGFAAYECRMERRPEQYHQLNLPLWKGEPLDGKTVLVVSEQGYGDTILFSRFIPFLAARASKVVVCVTLTLVSLLWEFRHLVEFLPETTPIPDADFYMHMGSLPLWYGLGENPPPPDPGLIAKRVDEQHARATVSLPPQTPEDGALKVGICWTGRLDMERNDERMIPLELLAGLANDPWVWLYSLQYGDAGDRISELGLDDLIIDLRPKIGPRGFVGTGCLMRQLDLVITCCTSVAHLAGALGVPCWVLLCSDPYWTWGRGEGEASHWYPSVKLYRQSVGEGWPAMIERVKEDLLRLCPANESELLLAAE